MAIRIDTKKNGRKKIIANWKMNPSSTEKALKLASETAKVAKKYKNVEVIICPPYIYIEPVIKKTKIIPVGAQDTFYEKEGSFTGEISPVMIKNSGAEYVIVGHSESRKRGDTDEDVNQKIQAALKANLKPVICIGESHRDEDGHYLTFIKQQLERALRNIPRIALPKISIAYEPLFAIGAAEPLAPTSIHEMVIYIKKVLTDIYDLKPLPGKRAVKFPTSILYGGAVDAENAREILEKSQSDGLLVGRQSLDSKSFATIIESASFAI